jgi:hypothetical protein
MDLSGPFYGHESRPCKLPEAGRSSAARHSEVGVRRSLDTYVELLHAPKKSTNEYRLDCCAWNFKLGEVIAPMKTRLALLLLALAAALPAAQAQTGEWPDKPVRVVVPFAPGGSTDIIARVLTARLSQEFGQQFIVDNRSGAGGSLGTDIVVRANPDGYTVIIVATSYATNAALYKLPYDPVKDIAPVAMLHKGPFVFAVNTAVPAKNVKEFIELARAKPRTLNYGREFKFEVQL